MIPEEWNEAIIQDLEFLKKAGLIDIVGINEDGEWLYALAPKIKEKIDEADNPDDIWENLSALMEEARGKQEDKGMEEGPN